MPALNHLLCAQWFDDDGKPLKNWRNDKWGCRMGSLCNYAHPEDEEWATASLPKFESGAPPRPPGGSAHSPRRSPSPYGPPPPPPGMPPPPGPWSTTKELPPRMERVVSASSAYSSDRDRDRDRDSATRSPSRTRHSTGRPRDISPGTSSIASSSDPRARKTSYSTLPPPERRREEDRVRYRDDDRRREDERRRDDDRRYDDRKRDREDDRRREDERRQRDDRSREHGSRSRSLSLRPKEVPEEERRRIWMERIKFLTESVLARGEIVRLHEDVLNYERISRSAGFERLESADKVAMEELIATTKQRAQAKQAELDATLSKLVPSDYYPFVTAPSSRASDAAFDNMTQSLTALRKDVEALFAHVEKLRATAAILQTPVTPLAPAPAKPEAGEITADPARPKKRRRLSVEQSSEPSTQVSDPTAADFDVLKDRLVSLDGRIAGLENDFRQYDTKVADEVDAQLDYRGISKNLGGPSNVELTETYEKLERRVTDAGGSAAEITATLKQLSIDGDAQDKKYGELLKENQGLQTQVAKLQQHQLEIMDELKKKRDTLEALTAAVIASISQPPQPPPPQPITATEIITAVQPRVLRAVRDDIQPLLSDLQTEIDKLLKDQMNEVNGTLIAQISPTIRAVEAISAWVDRYRQPPANGNAPSAPGPSSAVSVDKGKSTAHPS
ncbi:hypothetical protein L227DRAFT_570230 [Lentinus tigrinus ALCF2SS1-6]|uniref:C3H1-type domain-containing protein n=1 Tax=Lentinus tigrinus ALCF2SS1-6 TaxID=1328759 RepID=A0A5C2SSJ4_9APHY|nr:hypothetical protein L227DRAFT_570230 [Lentinus tigrinus ALCF2SS1-6]